jgi:hypothetical protein
VLAAISNAILQINALIGFFLPLVVSVFQHYKFPTWFRVAIAAATSLAAGVFSTWAEGKLDWTNWGTAAIIIFTTSQLTYVTVWKPTGIAPKVEEATSPSPPA